MEVKSLNPRKIIADYAKKGAKIKNLGRMCGTCAFKLNSDGNLEPHNAGAALGALAYYGQFNCHIKKGVDKGCVCIGFKHAKQHLENES